MTTNTHKKNNNRNPEKGTLSPGGWEGKRKTNAKLRYASQPAALPRHKPCKTLHNVSTCTGAGKH